MIGYLWIICLAQGNKSETISVGTWGTESPAAPGAPLVMAASQIILGWVWGRLTVCCQSLQYVQKCLAACRRLTLKVGWCWLHSNHKLDAINTIFTVKINENNSPEILSTAPTLLHTCLEHLATATSSFSSINVVSNQRHAILNWSDWTTGGNANKTDDLHLEWTDLQPH